MNTVYLRPLEKNDLVRFLEYAKEHKRIDFERTKLQICEEDIQRITYLIRVLNAKERPIDFGLVGTLDVQD